MHLKITFTEVPDSDSDTWEVFRVVETSPGTYTAEQAPIATGSAVTLNAALAAADTALTNLGYVALSGNPVFEFVGQNSFVFEMDYPVNKADLVDALRGVGIPVSTGGFRCNIYWSTKAGATNQVYVQALDANDDPFDETTIPITAGA